MRIKTQLLISIITFSIILVIIGSSVALTQIQITELNNQSVLTNEIQTGASNLNYISNNYFLYQDNSYITLWQTKFSTLSNEITTLNSTNLQQQTLVNTVSRDMENLNSVFAGVTTFLSSAPRNESIRVLPSFQTQWNRMAVQIQALAFDSQQLSQNIQDQTNQIILINTILTVVLLGMFGVFFITIYFVAYRRTARSIIKLKNGINVIGSGNLGYIVEAGKKDEIEDISKSVNQMAANLKTVTASKTDLEQAQASLRESEQRWATTLASIGDAVIATDLLGKVMFMNGVAEELTGWKLNEASLKSVKEIFNIVNEQTRIVVEDPVSKVLEKGLIVGLANHTVLIRKNKTEVAIDDSGAPIKDKEGKTTGVVLIFRDITERKIAEDSLRTSEEQFRRSIEEAPIPIIMYDEDEKILQVNRKWTDLTGYTKAELPTTEAWLTTVSHVEGGKELRSQIRQLIDEKDNQIVDQIKVKTIKGEDRYWTFSASSPGTLANGRRFVVGMAVDVTERNRLQEKLEDSSARIEEYANQMEQLANERADQLKAAERLAAIGATAGMVGHDIRNPLQAITSDIYLAKTDLATTPESEEKKNVKESLEEIEKNVQYINKIVSDLQDFARPLAPKLEEIDLEKAVHSALANINIPGNITVKHSIRKDFPNLKVDPAYIQRILTNLSNNAIQAMPKGGKLTIAASSKNGKATITVEDTGEGIPESVRSKLFTPLITTKSKGQGFGLSVVKRFTEAMAGTVTFESEIGKGTKFTIELPL